jgi:hypothetical protein
LHVEYPDHFDEGSLTPQFERLAAADARIRPCRLEATSQPLNTYKKGEARNKSKIWS